jgi:hypothetical protein
MLYQFCQNAITRFFSSRDNYVSRAAKYFEFPFSVSALQDSAQSGCELCSSLVSDSLEEGRTDDEKANERSSWSTCSDDGLSPEDENIRVRVSSGKIFYLYDAEGGVGSGASCNLIPIGMVCGYGMLLYPPRQLVLRKELDVLTL